MQPTAQSERIQLLDVLRGIAIFGMFAVNMTLDLHRSRPLNTPDMAPLEFWLMVVIYMFANGKFISIFSFMYGIGFYLQYERAQWAGSSLAPLFLRRSAGLLLIGLTGMALTSSTWILVDYAVLGLPLLMFQRLSPRTILAVAVGIILAQKVLFVAWGYGEQLERVALAEKQGVPAAEVLVEDEAAAVRRAERSRIMASGSLEEISAWGLKAIWRAFTDLSYYVENAELFAFMLLGLFVGKLGLLRDPAALVRFVKKALPWLLTLGLGGSLAGVLITDFGLGDGSTWSWLAKQLFYFPVGTLSLGLAYAGIVTLLMQQPAWQRSLRPFAAVGRIALSNYLVTCVVGAAVIFPWGLGLYDRVSPALGLLICFGTFAVQVVASNWWLGRFRFGPFEWLWRAVTYGKLPPMRLQAQT